MDELYYLKLDLLLTKFKLIKLDIEEWEQKGYKIPDYTKDLVDNAITYIEHLKKSKQIHEEFEKIFDLVR